MNSNRQVEEQNFVEEVGITFEQTGMPRMAGRILGCLLIADPPHQSVDDLTNALMASKGSISTMTRFLIQVGLIERLSLPGVRHTYFRFQPHAWRHMMKRGLEDEITMFHHIAKRGLELTETKTLLTRQWLEEMLDVYSFLEREFPALLERWEQERKEKQLTSESVN